MSEKILIVDDDIDSLKLIGLMLQRHGYEVMAASSGTQALQKASADLPDLIILDIMMPDMDGYDVCRRLRAEQHTQAIPIIMFTAKTLVDDKVAGFEAGADDYLTKPTHPAELASRVKAILARSAGQRGPEKTRSRTIGVLGAKGGVGTTTLALNMAATLVLSGENPIVTDFRLGAGSLGLMLGADGITGLANVLGKPTAEILPAMIEGELILHTSNLRALVASAHPREALLKYPLESAIATINGLRNLGSTAIFDLGCNFDETISRLQREMDQIVLVVDPSSVTVSLARELMNELGGPNRVNVVVINRQQSNAQLPWNEVEQRLNHELRAIISEASDLAAKAIQNETPMVMLQPNSIIANQIAKLCTDITVNARPLAGKQLTP